MMAQRWARALLPFLLAFAPAHAASTLVVRDAWIREAPPGAKVLAAYMTIENRGAATRTLVAASSPDFGAVEIHATRIVDGVASMVQSTRLPIPAHGRQLFAPGGAHFMLMQPRRVLRAGDRVSLTLRFSSGETITRQIPVTGD